MAKRPKQDDLPAMEGLKSEGVDSNGEGDE